MDLLSEFRAAWPTTPYPGDRVLSDCWCDECEFSVRHLRGKSWKEISTGDIGDEGGCMSPEAFRYYLPGILALSVQHPDEGHLASEINRRFVFSDHPHERREARADLSRLVGALSPRQRKVLLYYFDWLANQDWQAPILISAAKRAVSDGVVEPFSFRELDAWNRRRAAELRAGA